MTEKRDSDWPVDLPWGAVQIVAGKHAGKIGYYDDQDDETVIVYLGDPLIADGYLTLKPNSIAPVTTEALLRRQDQIFGRLAGHQEPNKANQLELLREYGFIQSVLADRAFEARFSADAEGVSVFISHSSQDKQFAVWLATDLADREVNPWLDEWQIKAGESIPSRVAHGIRTCDVVVVVLSEHAVASRWVEREWQERYWDEVREGRVRVIPVLLRDCEIPTLLRTKKYADFRNSYEHGLEDLLIGIGGRSA